MDHGFRSLDRGLVDIGTVTTRTMREEFRILRDEFAYAAVQIIAPVRYLEELDGWARSYYTQEGHMKAIEQYNREKLPEPADAAWHTTKQSMRNLVREWPQVPTKSFRRLDDVKWIRSSSAGYGYSGRKGDNDNYQRAKRVAVTIGEKLDRDDTFYRDALDHSTPDIAFTRTQLSQLKVKRKVRNVWGEAFHYVLLEGLFADNLIEYFIKSDTFYYLGANPLISVPFKIRSLLSEYDYVYQFDWSAFDATVQEWEIRTAFQLLEDMLVFDSSIERKIWNFVIELFIYRKVACPDGSLKIKTLGIPSGSCFTNIIGSIVNYHRIQYLFLKHTGDFAEGYTHGDDGMFGCYTTQAVPFSVFKPTTEALQWILNFSKSGRADKDNLVNFLSRTVREGANYRDELTSLRMLIYPEYVVEEGKISTLRAKSIHFDSGLGSDILYRTYKFLLSMYGIAEELPFHQRVWNPVEHEALRLSNENL